MVRVACPPRTKTGHSDLFGSPIGGSLLECTRVKENLNPSVLRSRLPATRGDEIQAPKQRE